MSNIQGCCAADAVNGSFEPQNAVNGSVPGTGVLTVTGAGKKTPGGAGTHTGHAGAQGHTDHIDEPMRRTSQAGTVNCVVFDILEYGYQDLVQTSSTRIWSK